ncbi:PRC-barrel domain-containing protein [Acidisoma cladoniae]|uniref:PRC-barrel domain-containing protein n=1 Tax=Acidisoma cladoniae TaxID=3040935 RepID=UPI00254B7FB2|nr:PRC-barrel domain-containing protein [Acidisoma sp. PAMC 29798]
MASIESRGDTSGELIAASNVSGTSVYDTVGEKLGTVYDVMLSKVSGRAEYAVISFGGFLGMGERYHPLPWHQLRYDTQVGGYVVDLDRNQLEGAPNYESSDLPAWDDRRRTDIDTYYGTGGGYDTGGLGERPMNV